MALGLLNTGSRLGAAFANFDDVISSLDEIRKHIGERVPPVGAKVMDHIDPAINHPRNRFRSRFRRDVTEINDPVQMTFGDGFHALKSVRDG